MGEANRARLEAQLRRLYASQREAAGAKTAGGLISAMIAEDARTHGARCRRAGVVEFVAAQVRYIPTWTWAMQAAFVALMYAIAHMAGDAGSIKAAVGILAAMTVLVGVPTVRANKLHGVAELEYACLHNAASVMVARLIVLGCSSALAVALMVCATAPAVDASAFEVAIWACPPFFLSCAGSLMALRRAHPAESAMLCVAWTAACSVALIALANLLPDLYARTSFAFWATAAALAFAWLAREVAMTLRAASAGLDAFSPHLARTCN